MKRFISDDTPDPEDTPIYQVNKPKQTTEHPLANTVGIVKNENSETATTNAMGSFEKDLLVAKKPNMNDTEDSNKHNTEEPNMNDTEDSNKNNTEEPNMNNTEEPNMNITEKPDVNYTEESNKHNTEEPNWNNTVNYTEESDRKNTKKQEMKDIEKDNKGIVCINRGVGIQLGEERPLDRCRSCLCRLTPSGDPGLLCVRTCDVDGQNGKVLLSLYFSRSFKIN